MNGNYKKEINVEIQRENDFPFGWLVIGMLAFLAFFSGAAHGQTNVERVESVGFTVSDMEKAVDFYRRVLSFEIVSDEEIRGDGFERLSGVFGARARVVRLRLGGEVLELTEYLNANGRPVPVDSKSSDRWFQHVAIIVSDMDKAFEILRQNRVRFVSSAPQTLPATIPAAAGIKAFYFRDFDNHVLEILQFPPGKGARKWHAAAKSGRLFLGIDHTAIVVGETTESLKFYRDALGLAVAGESLNFGTEQEHLNNVFGARVQITGLKTKTDGIAVEFLEYLAPRDGRAFPADTRSSDLWHWQTSFAAGRTDELARILRQNRFDFISNGVVSFGAAPPGFGKALLVRDPDGHAVRFVEK